MTQPVIKIEKLTKKYRLYSKKIDRIKEGLNPFGKKYHSDFFALKDVDITVNAGECIGVIGMNGSGKSTLLQLLAGVLTPTSGNIEVHGKVAALLELGAGFNPQFTGMENIYFQCAIMGYKREEIERKIPEILEFADIGEYVYQPVKSYSSGMYVRLAFAVAINVDPDVLIIDEALAVGDARFQAKCNKKIREFRDQGKTLLFVSHDVAAVKSLCTRAYLLHKGKVVDEGTPFSVFNSYNAVLAEKDFKPEGIQSAPASLEELKRRSGNKDVYFASIKILDSKGQEPEYYVCGEQVTVQLTISANKQIENPTIGIMIRDRLGNDIFGTNTFLLGVDTGAFKPGQSRKFTYLMELNVGYGVYSLSAALHSGSEHTQDNYDWVNDAKVFNVMLLPNEKFAGCCRLKAKFEIQND